MNFYVYRLELSFKINAIEDKISEYLGLDGVIDSDKWLFDGKNLASDDEWIDYISVYHEAILKNKKKIVEAYGDFEVTIWIYHEYAHRKCNITFSPKTLLQLAELGCGLCISCWEKDSVLCQC